MEILFSERARNMHVITGFFVDIIDLASMFVKVLGVVSGTRASRKICMFAICIAPVDRKSQDKFFLGSKPPSENISSHNARNMIIIQFCPSDRFAELTLCCVQVPSRLALAAPGSGTIFCFAAGGWAAATANAPETAMAMLRFVAEQHVWPALECVELGDVALKTVAGPTSVLNSIAVDSSAAACVASQSPGWTNTSNLAPVPGFCCGGIWGQVLVRNAERAPKQSHPSNCRSHLASAGAVSCGHRGDLSGHARMVMTLCVTACD